MGPESHTRTATEEQTVLVVYSYHPELEWNRALTRGLASAFDERTNIRVFSEYLDAKRWPNLEHSDDFLATLISKYQSQTPDLIILADDPAFERIIPYRKSLLANVPLVFMGLNKVRPELLGGVEGISGIFEVHETERTLSFALELTEAQGVVAINDSSATGRANELAIEAMKRAYPELIWIVHRDLPAQEIDELKRYPPDWPLLAMLPLRDGAPDGPMLSQHESVQRLRAALPNPIFYDVEWLMGSGLVGGYMFSGEEHAQQAAEIALAMLDGTPAVELPAQLETRHRWVFDGRELERFGWLSAVPPMADIRFATPSFFSRHERLLVPTLVGGLLALIAIAYLSATVARQRRAENQLRAQEQRLLTALSASDAGVFEIGPGGSLYSSERWLELVECGSRSEEPMTPEGWFHACKPSTREAFFTALENLRTGAGDERVEIRVGAAGSKLLDILMTVSPSTDGESAIVGVARDITQTRQLEEADSRRQRLNALGELAGGIAHDFNNILTVINVNSEMLEEEENPLEARRMMVDIRQAGTRAAELVQQLLAFGRQGETQGGSIDLNRAVKDLHQFLHRLLGEQHELVTLLSDRAVGVALNPAQADQVIANLVLNARDAMPEGGAIHVQTTVEDDSDGNSWSVLEVVDSGLGMDDETRDRVFEPYFTTKAIGEGTGLGLSTVYGIVNSSKGSITIDSTPGAGSTFRLRWPRTRAEQRPQQLETDSEHTHGLTILLVEDEPSVAKLTCTLLRRAGYQVYQAANGVDGLQAFARRRQLIDLVLTDVVLPQMSGIQMAREILRIEPEMPVGFLSGYARHTALTDDQVPAEVDVLGKPFSRSELVDYVDRCLRTTEAGRQSARALFPRPPLGSDQVH